jgi:hypothetical protein
VAPEADLIFVHLKGEDTRPEDNLGDSVRLLEAVRYILDRAGERPTVISLSLGKTAGPHDGSSLVEQALDAALEEPGRAIVMSAGNYFEDRLHHSGRISAGAEKELRWVVMPGNDEVAEMEVWYPSADRLSLELIDPFGQQRLRASPSDRVTAQDGERTIASAYNRIADPNNGDNQIDIFLWADAPVGTWTVKLKGDRITDGRYHSWIERDDARSQSRFHQGDATQTCSTGTICNGHKTIAVGAYDARQPSRPLAPFSSSGPTRDSRPKPLVSAPGVGIRAAKSSAVRGGRREMNELTVKSGTSMAAPHVAGVVALMMQAAAPRKLPADRIRRILAETARRSPPHTEGDQLRYGIGRINAAAAIGAAARADTRSRLEVEESAQATPLATMTTPEIDPEPAFENSDVGPEETQVRREIEEDHGMPATELANQVEQAINAAAGPILLTAAAEAAAVDANRRYSQSLGWSHRLAAISIYYLRLAVAATEGEFAQAIARWQQAVGLVADGILGPATWRRMRPRGEPHTFTTASGVVRPTGYAEVVAAFGDPSVNHAAWESSNIVRAQAPSGLQFQTLVGGSRDSVQVHRRLRDHFETLFEAIAEAGLWNRILPVSGPYAYRPVRGGTQLSMHAFGIAIDINPAVYAQGQARAHPEPAVVRVFQDYGYHWGMFFPTPDPMHFQFATRA